MKLEHDNRYLVYKAKKVVKEKRFINIIEPNNNISIFVYIGNKYDYILNSNSCTCPSYLYNVIFRKKYKYCYHILGLKFALESDEIKKIVLSIDEIREILIDIYAYDKSLKLRRILSKMESIRE
ncbi:MAG: SWIM zinc finger family protein [Saccharolobus sp.]